MAKTQVTEQMVRLSEPWREHLRKLLNDPIMQEAIQIVKAEYECRDVATEASEICSVRALSFRGCFLFSSGRSILRDIVRFLDRTRPSLSGLGINPHLFEFGVEG